MDHPVLVVPGIGNSDASHWQSKWQAAHPTWRRLEVDDWNDVECHAWVSALEEQTAANTGELLVVAHSLGSLAVAHWATRHPRTIRGALLVAVPDPASPAFPAAAARGFAPVPVKPLPFPAIVVSSADDRYGSPAYARACAAAWGSECIDVGAKGHLNAESGLGDWPEGLRLLEKLSSR